MGVHKPEEIEEFGKNDLKVLSDMLADKPFYFGDEPTTLDIVSFAVLSQLHFIDKEVALPLRDFMSTSCPNLVGHVSRMKERCFPDWDEICTKLDLNAHLPKPVPEAKEGKEADAEKKTEQENGEAEKELEKEKVRILYLDVVFGHGMLICELLDFRWRSQQRRRSRRTKRRRRQRRWQRNKLVYF